MRSLHAERLARFSGTDLYAVLTSSFCGGRPVLAVLGSLLDAGIKTVQLREKDLPDREYYLLARSFRELTERAGALLIIDDRPDIAAAVGADGVHLGQEDLPCADVRMCWPDLLIGVSTHSPDEILSAQEAQASYLNIGPVFPTRTKILALPPVGSGRLKEWIPLIRIPFTVMGGIKEENILLLREAGCSRFAMVTELSQADDIGAKVRRLREVLAS